MGLDPLLIFQHLVVAAKELDDVEGVFKYELCSHPPAIFEDHFLLRDPQKTVLADAIWILVNTSSILEIQGRIQMYWMVEHYVATHIRMSVHSTPTMSEKVRKCNYCI